MIIGKIAKAVIKLIMPDIVEHFMKIFKMDKLVSYMELPNEADISLKAPTAARTPSTKMARNIWGLTFPIMLLSFLSECKF